MKRRGGGGGGGGEGKNVPVGSHTLKMNAPCIIQGGVGKQDQKKK